MPLAPVPSGTGKVTSWGRGPSGSHARHWHCCGPGWSPGLARPPGAGGSAGQGGAQAALRALAASGMKCSAAFALCMAVLCIVRGQAGC